MSEALLLMTMIVGSSPESVTEEERAHIEKRRAERG
jgi:hypothetical protein